MNLLSPLMRLEVGGAEVLRSLPGPVLLAAMPSAPLDAWVIASAVPTRRRWTLRCATGDSVVQRAQLAAGNTLLAIADEQWLAELAVSANVPVIPVGVRGAFAVGDWADIMRRRIPRADDRPRVAVRFGAVAELPEDPQRALASIKLACARLVAEDETTWWESLRGEPVADDAARSSESWRDRWSRTGPKPRGGPVTRRRIWR